MTTKTLAIRLATGLAGSAALLGALVTPALAYYPYDGGYNGSAYCTNRYSPSCIQQNWGPGYFQPYNTNYNSWYMTSSPYYGYNNYSYSYPAYYPSYSCSYNCYGYGYPSYYYSTPNYSYQYQYQYQYSY